MTEAPPRPPGARAAGADGQAIFEADERGQALRRHPGRATARRCGVGEGSITALIGPNGAGKTTFFNVITGFYKPDGGTAVFDGQAVLGRPPYALARLGMVRTFQITKALAAMPVIDNMMLAAPDQPGEHLRNVVFRPGAVRRREREVEEQAMELLDVFNLTKLADQYAGTLSGGQRKLLELARALMAQPRFLLLDEPMAGINPTLGRRLLDHMQRLRAEDGRHLPLHRARHGGRHEPLRPGDRDGPGPGDRRRRAATRCATTRRDRRLSREVAATTTNGDGA